MKRKTIIIGAVVAVVAVIIAVFAGVSSHMSKVVSKECYFTGVQVEGMELGGLSEDEAKAKLDEYWNQLIQTEVEIVVGEKTEKISLADLGITYTNSEILAEAYALGREGSLFQNYLDVKNLEKEPVNFICCTNRANTDGLDATYCTKNVVYLSSGEWITSVID